MKTHERLPTSTVSPQASLMLGCPCAHTFSFLRVQSLRVGQSFHCVSSLHSHQGLCFPKQAAETTRVAARSSSWGRKAACGRNTRQVRPHRPRRGGYLPVLRRRALQGHLCGKLSGPVAQTRLPDFSTSPPCRAGPCAPVALLSGKVVSVCLAAPALGLMP